MSDSDIPLSVTLIQRTDAAILVKTEDTEAVWLPKRALHFACRREIEDALLKSEVEIRIAGNMAESKGLI